jgi:hypothetical protein
MRIVSTYRFIISVVILLFLFTLTDAQSFRKSPGPKKGNHALKRSPARNKQVKVREPKVVEAAKKKQEVDEKKRKRDYKKYVKENRARSLEIQSPEVRERMKQNRKNADLKYKNKKKLITARSKSAAKKYQ